MIQAISNSKVRICYYQSILLMPGIPIEPDLFFIHVIRMEYFIYDWYQFLWIPLHNFSKCSIESFLVLSPLLPTILIHKNMVNAFDDSFIFHSVLIFDSDILTRLEKEFRI